jgi:hypothetical protein
VATIQRINEPTFERRGGRDDRTSVRFKLNREPDEKWFEVFKAHAAASALGGTNATLHGITVSIEVAKPSSSVSEVATAVDCFIECANLKLRSLPAQAPERKPIVTRERFRLRGRV